jgi:multidrug transporter EmrE-like cation transporter
MIDTAGRLQNRADLMEELAKIVRVIRKVDPTAPHNTLLVLDATTGQNALTQVEIFRKIADVSGLVMTKLDGTAKGGVLVALGRPFGLPIHAIGVGEQIDDLAPFDPRSSPARWSGWRGEPGFRPGPISARKSGGRNSCEFRFPGAPRHERLADRAAEGTPAGHDLALALACWPPCCMPCSARCKRAGTTPGFPAPPSTLSYGLIAAPFALFVVPWPEPHMWPIFAGAFAIHAVYKVLQAMTYTRGAYTVVYPVVRGTGPLFTFVAAGWVFAETYTAGQWAGLGLLVGGILGLAAL